MYNYFFKKEITFLSEIIRHIPVDSIKNAAEFKTFIEDESFSEIAIKTSLDVKCLSKKIDDNNYTFVLGVLVNYNTEDEKNIHLLYAGEKHKHRIFRIIETDALSSIVYVTKGALTTFEDINEYITKNKQAALDTSIDYTKIVDNVKFCPEIINEVDCSLKDTIRIEHYFDLTYRINNLIVTKMSIEDGYIKNPNI